MFVRHGCMDVNHYIVSTQLKGIPKVFNLVCLVEVSCHSSADRHPAVVILASLFRQCLMQVRFGPLAYLSYCICADVLL